jgi:hypothetical protein
MSKRVWAALGTMPGEDDERGVQACIPRALTYLSEQDQGSFRKKFREQHGDEQQAMHTFRELLAGVFMARQRFTPRYEPQINNQTPDWHFQRDGVGEYFADVMNFHIDNKIEAEQKRALEGEGVCVWCDRMPDNSNRLYPSIQTKASKYKNLTLQNGVPFVVIVYGLFTACLLPHEVEACLWQSDGLFNGYPTLSGVYHMGEHGDCRVDAGAGYRFDYYANPKASYPAPWLPNGALPYLFPARED